MEKKKILIVEDDVFIRDIYQTKFIQEGFEVVAAENGEDALEKIQHFVPDIILLDLIMPFLDGIDVLEKIKRDEELKKVPVIMLTNISEKEKIGESMDNGADAYLIKSNFTPSEVVGKVKILLKM